MSGTSSTRLALRRWFAALIAAATAVLLISVGAGLALRGTASEFHTHGAPSIVAVRAAQGALIEADASAVCSFASGGARVAGPGEQYQNQISVANQSLAQVAQHNVAGDDAIQTVQLVNGLLVTYTGLIEQADAAYRQNQALGAVYLWYAFRLLHDPKAGILHHLDELYEAEKQALEGQLRLGGTSGWWILAWALPSAALLTLLVLAQLYLSRRFRRRVHPWLALATILLLGLVAGMAVTAHHGQQVSNAWRTTDAAAARWKDEQTSTAQQVERQLNSAVLGGCAQTTDARCPTPASSFGAANQNIGCGARPAALSPGNDLHAANALAAGAANTNLNQALVLAAALSIIALVVLGFRKRIDEYRYRSR
ncbi:hypothetical protein ACNAW0_19960 [Micromonospora sp. SL1-18]|uniref:hypothetical protein n=1 Tax=Micromonospora sp. SL1-18 TaxID=3399128 RepID=UPI003A4E61FE